MQTLKLKYRCIEEGYYDVLKEYMSLYSVCLHYLYNRIDDKEGLLSEKDLRHLSSNINGIDKLDSWFILSCVKESLQLYKSFLVRYKEHEESRLTKLEELEFKYSIGKLSDHKYSVKKKKIMSSLKLIFGGKNNLDLRLKLSISKDQYKLNRLNPLSSIGESLFKGNRKFDLNSDLSIIFKTEF